MRFALILLCVAAACTVAGGSAPADPPGTPVFRGACDGSAAVALPGGLILSGNDEDNVLRVYRARGGRPVGAFDMSAHLGLRTDKEADVEGAATKGAATYWITSHGRGKDGRDRPARKRFFATRWDGRAAVPVGRARDDLLAALLAAPELRALKLREAVAKGPEEGGVNIEGLADGAGASLLLGFRSPLVGADELAPVVPLLDAPAAIASGAAIRFGAPVLLDLGHRGVRSIERLPGGGYAIVAGPADARGSFALFRWSGRAGDTPVKVAATLTGLSPEAAVAFAPGALLLLSDDGTVMCKASPTRARGSRGRVVAVR